MAKKFDEVKKEHMKTLEMYVPIVARVHGEHHPEFHEVKKVFDEMKGKFDKVDADLRDDFARLRKITGNYSVPEDVCESYEAVYKMLEELDNAFHS